MKLFALFLLATGRQIAFAAEITGADETPKQIRNVLVRGGGDKASSKNKSEMLDDLPDEESSTIHRQLPGYPAEYDTAGTLPDGKCPVPTPTSAPDQYGCPPGKMAVCYWHASSKSAAGGHYHTKCWDYVTYGGPVVPSWLPGSNDKFFAYCGPCCFSDPIVDTALTIKIGKSAPTAECPFCAACGGADSILIFNPTIGTYAQHEAIAALAGCVLAEIDTPDEMANAQFLNGGSFGKTWIGSNTVSITSCASIVGDPFLRTTGTNAPCVGAELGTNNNPAIYECCPPTTAAPDYEFCEAGPVVV